MEYGDRIKEIISERGWSQNRLAIKIGKSSTEVSRYLSGKVTMPLAVLIKMSEILDFSIDEVVGTTSNYSSKQYKIKEAPLSVASDSVVDYGTPSIDLEDTISGLITIGLDRKLAMIIEEVKHIRNKVDDLTAKKDNPKAILS